MNDKRYEIFADGEIIAQNMRLKDAMIFIEAFFEAYYHEHKIMLSIREMPVCEGSENNDR